MSGQVGSKDELNSHPKLYLPKGTLPGNATVAIEANAWDSFVECVRVLSTGCV